VDAPVLPAYFALVSVAAWRRAPARRLHTCTRARRLRSHNARRARSRPPGWRSRPAARLTLALAAAVRARPRVMAVRVRSGDRAPDTGDRRRVHATHHGIASV